MEWTFSFEFSGTITFSLIFITIILCTANLGIILCNMIFDIRHGTVGDFDFASVENFVEYLMVWEGVIN